MRPIQNNRLSATPSKTKSSIWNTKRRY